MCRWWCRWFPRRWQAWCRPRPVALGLRGERAAEKFLRRRGLMIVARRVRGPGGELDLVAVEQRTVVFVEVKTRRRLPGGEPLTLLVTPDKQRRIRRAAREFIQRHRLRDVPLRFDIVTVLWPRQRRRPEIRHYRAAFAGAEDGLSGGRRPTEL
jgi:putative endonuclease